MNKFRAPAVPLVTVDPYFSIWSFGDNLYDDNTRHWTGTRNSMLGLISVDETWYRFMGKVECNERLYYTEPQPLKQKDVKILPLQTIYTFENEQIALQVTFMTPLLPNDLDLMSRPVSYISYTVKQKDGKQHRIKVYFDISSEACTDSVEQIAEFSKTAMSVSCGRGEKDVLEKSGDNITIDWGFLHLAAPEHTMLCLNSAEKKKMIYGDEYREISGAHKVKNGYPSLACIKEYTVTDSVSGFLCLAYDDIYSIELFGEKVKAYCYRNGKTFDMILQEALADFAPVCERVVRFQDELLEKARVFGGKYCDIVSLAYRQTVAAHKLVFYDGKIYFLSKECYSNACIGTVDVTYPSMPLFLIYNPDLVCGMLNPIFKYASMKQWEYPFAPHDVGVYPLADGQDYGYEPKTREMRYDMQMPVEECGNMLLCTAAICREKKDTAYAAEHKKLLTQWADYLVEAGWNPENQLCTDDFAGHLAQNCNLSIKAILGIAAWGKLLGQMGEKEKAEHYADKAREYAAAFKEAAFENNRYKLAFNKPDTWSIKYNLIWDKLLNLNIFDESIAKTEVEFYKTKINAYGLPLDSRSDYSKSDWQMWSCMLTDDKEYRERIINAMWDMLQKTPDRVPFTDWYFTSSPRQRVYVPEKEQGRELYRLGFQNRTVQGGLFILMM